MKPKQLAIISKDFKNELLDELRFLRIKALNKTASTVWLEEDSIEPAWAQCVWRNVKHIEFDSITDAQKKLKAISKTWHYYGDSFHRRGALIAEKLNRKLEPELFRFPPAIEKDLSPAFTLADPHMIFYSHDVQRPTPDGLLTFKENRATPPSRAYLKLWEALTLLGDWPRKAEAVVDLGASPGSWSWALAVLGTSVLSIDRSKLHTTLDRFKNIQFRSGDAFSLQPEKMDWVFSDVICYPEKLLDYMKTWLQSGHCRKFVCSVKFLGKAEPKVIDQFRKLPNSRILHLTHNKNEVTWISHPKIGTQPKSNPE